MQKNLTPSSIKLNIGCSLNPIPGWINCDNSLTLRISRIPILPIFLKKIGFISEKKYREIKEIKKMSVIFLNALKPLPFSDNSVDAIYISHVLNCFTRLETESFLKEAYRILKPTGILRISVPDLRKKIDAYQEHGNADEFIDSIYARRLQTDFFIKP